MPKKSTFSFGGLEISTGDIVEDGAGKKYVVRSTSNTLKNNGNLWVIPVSKQNLKKGEDGRQYLTEKDWDWIHNVNAKGTFFCLQIAADQMIKQNKGGRIINMASVGGKGFVDVSNAIYAASKGAVISLTKTAAQELAKYEITVNSICPGITYTNILSDIVKKRASEQNKTEEEIMKHYVRDIPLKRPNNPEDIASMVVFLSSEGARNISGQSYNIDGGLIPS